MLLTYDDLARDADASGLDLRGAFHPLPGEVEAEMPVAGPETTLVLLGFAGSARFAGFAAGPERADGAPDPLDRWSRRLVSALASRWGGTALFPFGGPPWHPFQRWARRAEAVHPSPIGLLIHPVWGLWHSYRGAVLLPGRIAVPAVPATPSPCETCVERPCLSGCPVGAYAPSGFDPPRCTAHLRSPEGAACMGRGCLARAACPVGREHAHGPDQAAFTMRAFLGSR